jgi:hypothetical protein
MITKLAKFILLTQYLELQNEKKKNWKTKTRLEVGE